MSITRVAESRARTCHDGDVHTPLSDVYPNPTLSELMGESELRSMGITDLEARTETCYICGAWIVPKKDLPEAHRIAFYKGYVSFPSNYVTSTREVRGVPFFKWRDGVWTNAITGAPANF